MVLPHTSVRLFISVYHIRVLILSSRGQVSRARVRVRGAEEYRGSRGDMYSPLGTFIVG